MTNASVLGLISENYILKPSISNLNYTSTISKLTLIHLIFIWKINNLS